jgi:4-amino-4-deoxy-L-arabinose transferase-like glycosyltransferase
VSVAVRRSEAAPASRRERLAGALRAVPRGFWLCFVVGAVNACVWAVVTPSFQVPDEVVHAGYVQYVAETGRIPRPIDTVAGHMNPSDDEGFAASLVPFSYSGKPDWIQAHDREAQHRLDTEPLSRKKEEGAGAAATYPPLYYVLEAIPYKVASAGNFYDRLLAMRLFSALFAGFTAAFCFLFVRELVPGSPWAWPVAGLAVAFQPLMAFVSGGVNAEALLYAASAALFYAMARAFRRGLTPRSGAAISAALTVALLAKGTALGFIPAIVAGLALMVLLAARSERGRALRGGATALAVGALPYLGWLVLSATVYDRPAAAATSGIGSAAQGVTLAQQLNYAWQLYFPRLPFMNDQLGGWPLHDIWFTGFLGRLGYNQYQFPVRFEDLAWWGFIALLVLVVVALVRGRRVVRRRWAEALTYLLMIGAIMGAVGIAVFRLSAPGQPVAQARYLLPLLAVWAGGGALAVKAPGRRFGPALGAFAVVAFAAWNFAAIMLTLGRYYA